MLAHVHAEVYSVGGRGLHQGQVNCWLSSFCLSCAQSEDLSLADQLLGGLRLGSWALKVAFLRYEKAIGKLYLSFLQNLLLSCEHLPPSPCLSPNTQVLSDFRVLGSGHGESLANFWLDTPPAQGAHQILKKVTSRLILCSPTRRLGGGGAGGVCFSSGFYHPLPENCCALY